MSTTTQLNSDATDVAQPRTRRRLPRVRVSVRALMLAVLLLAVGMGFYVRRVHIQQDAVAAILQAGGSVGYGWRWGNDNPNFYRTWRAPRWLARLVPADYVANVVYISLVPQRAEGPQRADDETLARIGRLGVLTHLELDGTAISDAGLAHLTGLTGLRSLRINNTVLSDAGLAHLKGLTELVGLHIAHTRVTDDGVLELERALPRLWFYRDEDRFLSNNMTRLIADLDFARSQHVRLSCRLLAYRAQVMKDRRDDPGFIATVDALCDLEAGDTLTLVRLAEALAGCLGLLDRANTPGLTATQRQTLQRRCTNGAIEALTRAVERGYDNLRRLEGPPEESRGFWNLHDHPALQKLIAAMKAKRDGR